MRSPQQPFGRTWVCSKTPVARESANAVSVQWQQRTADAVRSQVSSSTRYLKNNVNQITPTQVNERLRRKFQGRIGPQASISDNKRQRFISNAPFRMWEAMITKSRPRWLPRKMEGEAAHGFAKFKQLPGELQNLIWEFALPHRRMVRIKNGLYRHTFDNGFVSHKWGPTGEADDIAMRRTCRESRGIVLKYYKFPFAGVLANPVFYDSHVDYFVFYGQDAVLAFASRFNSRIPKKGRVKKIYLVSDALHQSEKYSSVTVLNTTSQAISTLNCWESIGFACMKLRKIQAVVLIQSIPESRSTAKALTESASLWMNRQRVEKGVADFFVKWSHSVNAYRTQHGDDCGGEDLARWKIPPVYGVVYKTDSLKEPWMGRASKQNWFFDSTLPPSITFSYMRS